jgi:hypothetical protein
MNIREITALILLYRACRDAALRARVDQLVPELANLAEVIDRSPVGGPVIKFGRGVLFGQGDKEKGGDGPSPTFQEVAPPCDGEGTGLPPDG